MSQRFVLTLATILAATGLSGCSDRGAAVAVHKTVGTITFENRPITGAFVVLHPQGECLPAVPKPRALVQSDGSFVATTYEADDGAPAGEYVVTVELPAVAEVDGEYVRSANLLPLRYASEATSGLTVQVTPGENTLPPIALRR
ncbi:MAG: hypothetical protein SFU86_23090 [Pirellulaceae bacterium]|nr:hypothetical protein [Pirellulaceae bacterium]